MISNNLRIIYSDIIRGFSKLNAPDFSGDFIKHFNSFDLAEIDEKYQINFNRAKEQNILDEKEQLVFLEQEGLWTKIDEKKLKDEREMLQHLELSKSKLVISAEVKQVKYQIEIINKNIQSLESKRKELLGTTAESFASRKTNQFYLFSSMFKEGLKDKYFSEEEFDDLDESLLQNLIIIYNEKSENFSNLNLKRIAISPFFLNSFSLAENDPYRFYGKPIIDLTFYQTEIFSLGKNYKNILSDYQGQITEEMMDNPDKLFEQYSLIKNNTEILNKNQGNTGATAIIGQTAEEAEAMGINTSNSLDIAAEMKKTGKNTLSFQEILALEGH